MNNTRSNPVARLADLGEFFAGDTGPPVYLVLEGTSGGLINLMPPSPDDPTVLFQCIIDVTIRRWNPTKMFAVGAVITSGVALPLDQTVYQGWALFDWMYAGPLSNVPYEAGTYMLQARVTFPDSHVQSTQRALFEVLPAFGLS